MQDQDKIEAQELLNKARSGRNKKFALVFGLLALAWYVVSMFTIWH